MTATAAKPARSHARGARGGFALVFSLLLLMALAVLSAGMLTVAEQEARIAGTLGGAVRARAAAESGIRRALAGWSTRAAAQLLPGKAGTLGSGTGGEVGLRRLDRTLFLLTSRAGDPDGTAAVASAGVLVRTIDLPAMETAARVAAAVVEEAVLEGGLVSGVDACPDGDGEVPALFAERITRTGGAVEGATPDSAPPPLPLLPYAEMAAIGAPAEPAAPRLTYAPGDSAVRGGAGAGVLVVNGDLTLSGGFTFHGLILVGGRILIEDATIRGTLRAQRLELRQGLLRYDSCLIMAALAAPEFDRPFRPRGRWWVPTF